MKEDLIIERKNILNDLGGISEPIVENKKWLYFSWNFLKKNPYKSILKR